MSRHTVLLAVATASIAVGGCGGSPRQDADTPSGDYTVDVKQASFPAKQQVSAPTEMRIVVENTGSKDVPDVAVTVDAFDERSEQAGGLSDPSRPVWIVDDAPLGGDTATTNTWALGPLKAGETREFEWSVTPVVPGRHTVKYAVGASLTGSARARTASGDPVSGSFPVEVSKTPEQSRVNPDTFEVEAAK